MSNTTNYNWPKPDFNTDLPNGAAQIGALADSIDSTVKGIANQLASASIGAGAGHTSGITITPATGWDTITQDWEIVNGWINLELTATRTGANMTGPSNGNLSNTLVATLADHRPPRRQIGSYAPVGGGGETSLNTIGQWILLSLMPSAVIATGDVVVALFSYPV